jgi:hypothetical protein
MYIVFFLFCYNNIVCDRVYRMIAKRFNNFYVTDGLLGSFYYANS